MSPPSSTPSHSRETLKSLYLSFDYSPFELELGEPVLMPALERLDLDWTCQLFMKSIVAPNLAALINTCPHDELSTPRLIFTMISHPQADPHSLGLLDLQVLYVVDEELSQTLLRSLALMVNLEVLQLSYDHCQPVTPHIGKWGTQARRVEDFVDAERAGGAVRVLEAR